MAVENSSPLRVIHFVHELEPGGIELWLLRIAPVLRSANIDVHLGVCSSETGSLTNAFLSAGVTVSSFPRLRSLGGFRRRLQRIVAETGPFHVAHSHCVPVAVPLWHAQKCGTSVRIAHRHNPQSEFAGLSWVARGLAKVLIQGCLNRTTSHGLASSVLTADAHFHHSWQTNASYQVLECGIELNRMLDHPARDVARQQTGLPRDSFIVGNVSRLIPSKNHEVLIRAMKTAAAKASDCRLVLVGDGPEKMRLESLARELGLQERIVFAGHQSDVSPWLSALDCFAFPSHYEGLGLSLVEAQAAGLPCIVSDTIPQAAQVIPQLICNVAPSASSETWAEAILSKTDAKRLDRATCAVYFNDSVFDDRRSAERLVSFYRNATDRTLGQQ